MKIAIVLKTFTTSRGGAEIWSLSFVKWLLNRGHSVHVLASKCSPDVHHIGATVHEIPRGSSCEFAEQCEQLLTDLDADIVHDMGCGWYFDVFHSHVGCPSRFRDAVQALMPVHRRIEKRIASRLLWTYRKKRAGLNRQFHGNESAMFIALSSAIAQDYRLYHNIPTARIAIIPNGVDVARFEARGASRESEDIRRSVGCQPGSLVLLLVAHDHKLKGLPYMVEAVSRLAKDGHDMRILVVGGKPTRAQSRQIRRHGLGDRVHFAGRVDDTREFYRAADLYVHPTHYDACSLAVLEAMASGLPVITSRANGASELFEHGHGGFILDDAANTEQLFECLELLAEPAQRTEMGIEARRIAEANPLHLNFERIMGLYQRILAQRQAEA